MGKLAFLYPGQGSQKVGMGSDIATDAPELFATYFQDNEHDPHKLLIQYCLEGPAEILDETDIAQRALFAHSLALTSYARQQGLRASFVAGHSLGEYTAAVAAGALDLKQGALLVHQRGMLMRQIQEQQPGGMAAVIGVPAEELQELCQSISQTDFLTIANWNTPTQTVVSGVVPAIQKLTDVLRSSKRGRVIRLAARGAFHTPLMKPVEIDLDALTRQLSWQDSQVPLVTNVEGDFVQQGQQIRQALLAQITRPVQWMRCVQTLLDAGCDTFLELGSGQVLSKLVNALAPQARVFSADTLAKVATFAKESVHFTAGPESKDE